MKPKVDMNKAVSLDSGGDVKKLKTSYSYYAESEEPTKEERFVRIKSIVSGNVQIDSVPAKLLVNKNYVVFKRAKQSSKLSSFKIVGFCNKITECLELIHQNKTKQTIAFDFCSCEFEIV